MTVNNNESIGRRRFVQLGALAGAGSVIPGAAAGSRDRSRESSADSDSVPEELRGWGQMTSGELNVQNGRVVAQAGPSAQSAGGGTQAGVQAIREGVRKGLWRLTEINGNVWVEFTQAGKERFESAMEAVPDRDAVMAQACGVSKRENGDLYLNDEDTQTFIEGLEGVTSTLDLAAIVLGILGAGAGAIVGGFAGAVLGALPGALVAILSWAVKNYVIDDIKDANEGCGVVIEGVSDVEPQ